VYSAIRLAARQTLGYDHRVNNHSAPTGWQHQSHLFPESSKSWPARLGGHGQRRAVVSPWSAAEIGTGAVGAHLAAAPTPFPMAAVGTSYETETPA
jgi:hypothetical protein